MADRKANVTRETRETNVSVSITLDGAGQTQVSTGNGMLDHLLSQLARHGLFDLDVEVKGDTQTGWHHTVEDTAIGLGRAILGALDDGAGIRRMGHALVPLDEALVQVVVDLSGRGYASIDLGLSGKRINDLPGDLVHHFLETLAIEGRMNLHAKALSGVNTHHIAEAAFKALARSLRDAIELDPRSSGEIPSTKGTISG
jgi:imidazoleglycerol-phosphate dehydratase